MLSTAVPLYSCFAGPVPLAATAATHSCVVSVLLICCVLVVSACSMAVELACGRERRWNTQRSICWRAPLWLGQLLDV